MRNLKKQEPLRPQVFEGEALLERYFEQLLQWGQILTRGDAGMAEEIVQDLCLQLTLASPDLSKVANLNGYLYTCLRNMYVSSLSRASRDRLRLVSLEDFDSVESALTSSVSGDILERQNALLRICAYAVWRKNTSKSASYLILHFFHGYHRGEVAEVARLPIAAIYNKLKDARAEVREHLQSTSKMRILDRNAPPEPQVLIFPIPSEELFAEVRTKIFSARNSPCLTTEALLAHYQDGHGTPIPCPLLSHIVSCERCLRILDEHSKRPTLDDRGPMDGYEPPQKLVRSGQNHAGAFGAMMTAVRKRREQVREHRPGLLAIAVDGKIVAFHDIQGRNSSLSSRIDDSTSVRFIEVFSEQQVRLAQLPIDERPPQAGHLQTQRISLSDNRWLELNVRFDGLGVHAEVHYFDPALAAEMIEETIVGHRVNIDALSPTEPGKSVRGIVRDGLDRLREYAIRAVRPPVLAGAVAVAVLAVAGIYVAHRHETGTPFAQQILGRAAAMEAVDVATETEHQILQIDRVSADGIAVPQGTVELWRDGNGKRYVRRLYDPANRLLATEWQAADGGRFTTMAQGEKPLSGDDRTLVESGLWKHEVSSRSFEAIARRDARVSATSAGFEVTTADADRDDAGVLSQTLVLDRGYRLVEERLSVRRGGAVENVRLMQAVYRKERRESVPDSIFQPGNLRSFHAENAPSAGRGAQNESSLLNSSPAKLARLQVAVLFELNKVNADTVDPIAVEETPEGRIRVMGVVADEQRLAEIRRLLGAIPDHDMLDNSLVSSARADKSPGEIGANERATRIDGSQLDAPLAAEALRRHFTANGLSGPALDAAVLRFSGDALQHAQRALQSAYALDRLGSILVQAGPNSLDLPAQQKWSAMVAQHALSVQTDLQALRSQLEVVSAVQETDLAGGLDASSIAGPTAFHIAARKLRNNVQVVNIRIGTLFAGSAPSARPDDLNQLLLGTIRLLPLKDASQMQAFATRLSTTGRPVHKDKNHETIRVP